MAKTIIKEAAIILLLLVAIALILAIIFYDYIPSNKTIPAKVEAYYLPKEIEAELEADIQSEQNIVRTYYIDSSDLNLYESTKEYDKGKVNPFAGTITNNTTTNTTTNTNANTTNSTTNNTTANTVNSQSNTATQTSESTGTFFNKAGKF